MASRDKKTIRFAVGPPHEARSSIWRLWVQGNETYLSTRGLASTLKLSLHQSGKWRLAWTSDSELFAQGTNDRVEQRWERPPEFYPGWVHGPTIIIPDVGLAHPLRRDRCSKPCQDPILRSFHALAERLANIRHAPSSPLHLGLEIDVPVVL